MELTSEQLTKRKGSYTASLQIDYIDGQFHSVSFGVVTKNGVPLNTYIQLTPYGLIHTYEGEYKGKVDEIVGLLSAKLAETVGITYEQPSVDWMPVPGGPDENVESQNTQK